MAELPTTFSAATDAMVGVEHVERCVDVRHLGHDVVGIAALRLWIEERVHSLVLAGVQSDLSDGLFVGLVAAFRGHDGGRMDHDAVRPRSGAEASRFSVVLFALVSVIAFTGYAFVGIAKFSGEFLPDALFVRESRIRTP